VIVAVAIASIVAFLVVFWKIGVVPAASQAATRASAATRVIASKELGDEVKERETQKAALGLLGDVFSILWRSIVALVAAAVPIYGAEILKLTTSDAVVDFLARWDVIIIASLIIIAGYVVGQRLWPAK
jgi:hypothetical protein